MLESVLADNGLYLIAAYAAVFGGIGSYVIWLRARLAALTQRNPPSGVHDG